MELPNYSRQLTQQLRSLRKEGQFCDCSILVGDAPHQAHKVVLAASSLLFRSLLEGSDTISIDTAVASSQEFSCLLDMVYTGKLPPGKHNFTRIIAAADSLQMFDVAVGCKNILANLMKQSTTITANTHTTQPAPPSPTTTQPAPPSPTTTQPASPSPNTTQPAPPSPNTTQPASPSPTTTKPASPSPTTTQPASPSPPQHTGSLQAAVPHMEVGGVNIGPSGAQGEEPGLERGMPTQAATQTTPMEEKKDEDEPPSKRACLQRPESTAGDAKIPAEVGYLWHCLKGLQTWDNISTGEKQVILSCCEGDPGGPAVFLRLQSRVREQSSLTAQTLLTLLSLLREFNPNLATLLQEHQQQLEDRSQGATGSSGAEELEEQTQSATGADTGQVGEEEEEEEDTDGEGEGKTRSEAKRSSHRFSCRWCSKAFDYKCRMAAHTNRCPMSQEATLQCPECAEELPTPRALQLHRNKVHPESKAAKKKRAQVSCDICDRTFAHPSGMLYHKRTEHFEQKPFVCEECGDKFGANSSLKNHMRLHTGEKPYHCKSCEMSFSVAAALAYHTKKKHSEGKMYSCQYCEALFAQSIELTRHVRTHTGDKPYVCRECGKGFSQANGLSAHLHTTHNVKEPHDCQKCRLSFPSLEEHRKHIQECHPKEFHQCPECSKTFTSPALLQKHAAVHAGGKPYSCQICQRSYQQMSGLWYHNRTNHPEVFGGQTNRQLKSLLQCSVCSKFFPSASSLAKHQRTEHPASCLPEPDAPGVKCPHCPGRFPTDGDLQEHTSIEHFSQEGAAVGCSLCPLVCPSQLQLQEHFLSCHIGVLEEQTSPSQTETEADPAGEAEQVISVDQSQQVFVALGNGEDGGSSSEVMAVNMEDLLNGTVTFICD